MEKGPLNEREEPKGGRIKHFGLRMLRGDFRTSHETINRRAGLSLAETYKGERHNRHKNSQKKENWGGSEGEGKVGRIHPGGRSLGSDSGNPGKALSREAGEGRQAGEEMF